MQSKIQHDRMPAFGKEEKGRIQGQAFSKTRGGDVKYGAGVEVRLFPDIPYSRELIDARSNPWRPVQGMDPAWHSYVKTTIADGTGNFEFNGVPAGNYFLETSITWEVPSQYGPRTTGGLIRKTVTVFKDQTVRFILTD